MAPFYVALQTLSRLQSYLKLTIQKICSLKTKTVAIKVLFTQWHDKNEQRHEQNQWSVINRKYEEHNLFASDSTIDD